MPEIRSPPECSGGRLAMDKLLARQIATATDKEGKVDLAKLVELVSTTYAEAKRDQEGADRAINRVVEELEQSHARLRFAFDALPEGVAVFDGTDRLVLWNSRYEHMTGVNDHPLRAGQSFESILRGLTARGKIPGGPGRDEQWIASRLAQFALPTHSGEQPLPDGRWLKVDDRRTPDGGSVALRVDITELKRREASFRLLFDSNPI